MTHLKASLLLYAILCAQVADWGSTVYAMSFGATEANPVMAPLFAISPWRALLPKLLVVAVLVAMWIGLAKEHQRAGLCLLVAHLAISTFPVAWNLYHLAMAGLL